MLKFTAKMTLVVAMLGMAACASSPVEEPRSPSSYNEETQRNPWHYPYVRAGNRVSPY